MHSAALERLRESIKKDTTQAHRERAKRSKLAFSRIMPLRKYGVTINNREEFYLLVNWLNKRVGKGGHHWTVSAPVLKYVDPRKRHYNPPKICNWTIFKSWVDVSDAPVFMGPAIPE